ncbi:hypothetical protein BC834DRAFT_902413 [Gloeopeniophorella convolvens]|nr:hypothetical protein BC834DRAFT_902413 [Gloeopeniophorella convolvens]
MSLRGATLSARLALSQASTRCSMRVSVRRYSATNAGGTSGHEESDVVIVGGGPAGLALASALGSNEIPVKVTLVEGGDLGKVRDWTMSPDAYSNRVVSLTNTSLNFLEEIGAWEHVEVGRTCAVEDMQVWDGISGARIEFNAAALGVGSPTQQGQMSRLTENLNLQRGLLRHLDGRSNVTLLDNTKVENILSDDIPGGGWPMLQLSNGHVLRARLLVGADGINSPVRAYSKIDSYGWDYQTRAIVATLHHPPQTFVPNTTAYQRFLPTGPIAFLPLSPTVSSLVWSTKPELAAILTKTDPENLAYMINAAFRLPELSMRYLHARLLEAPTITPAALRDEIAFREQAHGTPPHASVLAEPTAGVPTQDGGALPPLVTHVQPGSAASFPLRLRHAESYLGPRTALVGDAAHVVHPLAGQGLNLGLGDAAALARCVRDAVARGGDVGSYTALAPYARARYLENHAVMGAVDKLHKLYARTEAPVVWARSTGLEVINELDTLKAGLMGAAGASPRSSAGVGGLADALASGVEMVTGGARVAQAVAGGLQAVAVGALQQLARAAAGSGSEQKSS